VSPTSRPQEPLATALTELAERLGAQVLGDPVGVTITGVSLSTDRVQPGDLYAALPGARAHGADFADKARRAGAVAVLTDRQGADRARRTGLPVLEVGDPRAQLGALAATVYGDPAAELTLLGVTGTQGKTTTTRLLEAGLEQAGIRAAVVGTVGTRIAGTDVRTALTTPEAPDLQALFAVMREQQVQVAALEVSSHALVLGRVDGVVFDVAAFLNLGRDHLDFHADLEEYFAAKASLFTPERARVGLTNVDDIHGRRLLREAGIPMRTFSPAGDESADWRAVDLEHRPDGTGFTVLSPDGRRFAADVPIPGDFNVANALCAIALAGEAGLDPQAVADGIASSPGVPGRLERIDEGQDFLAVVDYAHKPDAVEAVLMALRPRTRGRLIVVLGAGGDRDTGKRPLMGEIAAEWADVLIVTDDNPRSEEPAAIRAALLAGARESLREFEQPETVEIGDRAAAIRHAIGLARAGDTVLVAGKGHETGQEALGVVTPFNDREEVRAALRQVGR